MIKIPDIRQIRDADQYTIEHEPVSSDELMERAAGLCFEWIKENFPDTKQKFSIWAGAGNNGGDGLVIARMLHESGYRAEVLMIKSGKSLSKDCQLNLDRLKKNVPVIIIEENDKFPATPKDAVIVDALLGSGLTREPEGLVIKAIEKINSSKQPVISIDLPSGLLADRSSLRHSDKIVKADVTLTIGAPKLALFMPENGIYSGVWHFIPIGLHEKFIREIKTNFFLTQGNDIPELIPARPVFSHKGTFGHALIMAGSKGKTGAAVLAARACLRSGCGLTTVHCPAGSLNILQSAVPEAMASVDSEPDFISSVPDISPYSTVAFGPGCGQNKATASALKMLIQESKKPLVIDADGLNIISENKTWLAFLPENSILTPHPGEFKRLFGDFPDDFARLEGAMAAAVKFRCIIVLKGAYTAIVTPSGQVFFNPTGNPGMAKGGSGDVLTGLLAGLLARGIAPVQATLLGVWLHGMAGDIASEKYTQEAMTAGGIISSLSYAWASAEC